MYKSKELTDSEDVRRNEQLGRTWSEIYMNIVEMWASPIYNANIPGSYPDDLLQFKIGLKIDPAFGLLRKWTYSYINPTVSSEMPQLISCSITDSFHQFSWQRLSTAPSNIHQKSSTL